MAVKRKKYQHDKYLFLWARPLVRGVNPMGATEQSGHHLIIRFTAHKITQYNTMRPLGRPINTLVKGTVDNKKLNKIGKGN